jgi:hypothetical protein
MNKQRCLQQAYLDGWERCRLTMLAELEKMLTAGRLIETTDNSVEQIRFAGHNPTQKELDEYQDWSWELPNEARHPSFDGFRFR